MSTAMINGLGKFAKLALGVGTAGAIVQTALYDGTRLAGLIARPRRPRR